MNLYCPLKLNMHMSVVLFNPFSVWPHFIDVILYFNPHAYMYTCIQMLAQPWILCKYISRCSSRSKGHSSKTRLRCTICTFSYDAIQTELWTAPLRSYFYIDIYQVCNHKCFLSFYRFIGCVSDQKFRPLYPCFHSHYFAMKSLHTYRMCMFVGR